MKEIWAWLKPADYKDKEGNNIIMDWWMVILVDEVYINDTFQDIVKKAEKVFLVLENITEDRSEKYEVRKEVALRLLKGYTNMKVIETFNQGHYDVYIFKASSKNL